MSAICMDYSSDAIESGGPLNRDFHSNIKGEGVSLEAFTDVRFRAVVQEGW